MQNVEIGLAWEVRGHPRSTAMSPFDRSHMTSYLTLIENYVSVLYHFRVVKMLPILTYHTCMWRPLLE